MISPSPSVHHVQEFLAKNPINFVEVVTATVKPTIVQGRHRFELVTVHRSYWFQAPSQAELTDWVQAIQEAVATALSTIRTSKTGSGVAKSLIISGSTALQAIREIPSNQFCADCKAPDPDWSSINLGIVVCIECSGIHRSLGVSVSKVRSLPLDEWTRGLIAVFSLPSFLLRPCFEKWGLINGVFVDDEGPWKRESRKCVGGQCSC